MVMHAFRDTGRATLKAALRNTRRTRAILRYYNTETPQKVIFSGIQPTGIPHVRAPIIAT